MCLDAFETVSLVNLRALLDDVTDLFLVSDAQCIISQFLQWQKMRFIVFKFVQLWSSQYCCVVPVYLQWQKRSKHSSWQWQTGRWKSVGSVCLAHLPPCVQPSFGYMTTNDFWPVVFRGKYTLSFSWLVARLVSHTHTHTIDVIVDVRMTSRDVIVGIRKTSLPVYGHTECDTRLGVCIS